MNALTRVQQEPTSMVEAKKMLKNLIEKAKKSWTFAVAAASLPLSYLLFFPCFGNGCAGCPTGGACLISAPMLIGLVLVAKSFTKIKTTIKRFTSRRQRSGITA